LKQPMFESDGRLLKHKMNQSQILNGSFLDITQ